MNILEIGFFVRQKFGILVSTGRPEKVSQFPFDECIKKARVFPLSQRFQTRDRRKLTYSKELIIGARPPLACFSPSAFSYCNSSCYGVFKSGTTHDSDFLKFKEIDCKGAPKSVLVTKQIQNLSSVNCIICIKKMINTEETVFKVSYFLGSK